MHFNWAMFTSHVLCHDKDRGVGKNLSCSVTIFLIEGYYFKRINKLIVKM